MVTNDFPHITATLRSEHEILFSNDDTLIVFNKKAGVHIAEGRTDIIVEHIGRAAVCRLETTNREVFDYFSAAKRFRYSQICFQCRHKKKDGESLLKTPTGDEIRWIAETYGTTPEKIDRMRSENRIFVLRKGAEAVSYIGIHIDGSIGCLYTKPEYRHAGYATETEEELLKIAPEPVFAQILESNEASIALHRKNGWIFSNGRIYWLFNESF